MQPRFFYHHAMPFGCALKKFAGPGKGAGTKAGKRLEKGWKSRHKGQKKRAQKNSVFPNPQRPFEEAGAL
jgi:hypothetical protein